MIDAYASRPHYWRHMRPVVDALRLAGHAVRVWAPRGVEAPWGDPEPLNGAPMPIAPTVLVASEEDACGFVGRRDVVYLEHGAGQTYVDGLEWGRGYAGGPGLDHAVLFLCPREEVADRWRTTYPATRAVAIGCPALDRHERCGDEGRRAVAITGHWRCGIVPETWPALYDFEAVLPTLKRYLWANDRPLVGHAHPKDSMRMMRWWGEHDVPVEPDADVVLEKAGLLIADNTSLIYEAAALDIPIVLLNGKGWRRDVEHGLRFWDALPGPMTSDPYMLVKLVADALDEGRSPYWQETRRKVTDRVYCAVDGRASVRAVEAIEGVLP